MSDKLTWFKFSPADWMMGKIQRCSEVAQARFIRLCCLYWNKKGVLSAEDAEIELEEDVYAELLKKKVIKEVDGMIIIEFLDEQNNEIDEVKKTSSKSGALGNLKRWHPEIHKKVMSGKISLKDGLAIANQSRDDRPPIAPRSQNIAEENREEKSRKEENSNTPIPPYSEFQDYAFEKSQELQIEIDESKLKAKYLSWEEAGWKTGKGARIKNWKSTLLNTLNYLQKEKSSGKKESLIRQIVKDDNPYRNRQTG